jgi:uncharacterized membrane protein YphA (DoxX/SURF4 family)
MNIIRRFAALLVGAVFFIAGALKLMDPVGTGLITEEYLRFLGLRFMLPAANVLGEAGALTEALLGAALITGVWRKWVLRLTGILLLFFTGLTALLWVKNPPMDCGCFGEALHLTHAQSFWKNIVLLLLWAIAALPTRRKGGARRLKKVAFALSVVAILCFAARHLWYLPSDDFTDLRPGAELMREGEEMVGDVSLPLYDFEGEYRNELLTDSRAMVFSVYNPERMGPRRWQRIQDLRQALPMRVRPVLLVATTPARAAEFVPQDLLDICYFCDRRQLMTLNRSNGGATLIFRGYVVAKWSTHAYPDREELQALYSGNETEAMMTFINTSRLRFQAFLLGMFAIMLLL